MDSINFEPFPIIDFLSMIGKYAVKSILFFKEDSLNDAWKAYRFSDRLVND